MYGVPERFCTFNPKTGKSNFRNIEGEYIIWPSVDDKYIFHYKEENSREDEKTVLELKLTIITEEKYQYLHLLKKCGFHKKYNHHIL